MSAFRPSAGGGSGLTPEQLDALVSDPELAGTQATVLAAIAGRASQASADALAAQIAAIPAGGSSVVPGTIQLFSTADGTAPSGWERVSGLSSGEWAATRLTVLPLRYGVGSAFPDYGTYSSTSYSVFGYGSDIFVLNSGQTTAGKAFGALSVGTLTWRVLAPSPRSTGIGSCCFVGAFLYAIADKQGAFQGNSTQRYSAANDTWTALPGRPLPANLPVLLARPDGKLLAVGGITSSSTSDANVTGASHLYDPTTESWSTLADAPVRVHALSSCPIVGTSLHFVAARTATGVLGYGYYIVDGLTNTWTEIEALPAGYSAGSTLTGHPGAAGTVVLVASGGSDALGRGLLYTHSAPSGSRFTPYDLGDSTAVAFSPIALGTSMGSAQGLCPVFLPSATGYPALAVIKTNAPTTSPGASFYARKL